jgi:hypothetical protein|nr:MAG TPA: hypothetical protein [Crassvirales sp.]
MEERRREPQYNNPKMVLHLATYGAVSKYKSIRRAIRKGHVTHWGEEVPKRPFNNRKRTAGRKMQTIKEKIYGQLTSRSQAN